MARGQQLPQELGEEVVVPVQRLLAVERNDEEVFGLELDERRRRIGSSGHGVTERNGELVEYRGFEEEPNRVVGLAPQHLTDEEVGDVAIRAREVVDELRRLRLVSHRERGELHARGPTFGSLGEHRSIFGRDLDADLADELADLGRGQSQVGGADLTEPAGGAPAMQGKARIGARAEHHSRLRRKSIDELGERFQAGAGDEVQILDHEHVVGVVDEIVHDRCHRFVAQVAVRVE